MFLRSAILACAATFAVAAPVQADAPARCEPTNFRVYFGHGSATLDATTIEILDAAERNVAGCSYAELRVALDASSPEALARGNAIAAAAADRAWDAVRLESRPQTQSMLQGDAPEYAEVVMTPERSTAPSRPLRGPANTGA